MIRGEASNKIIIDEENGTPFSFPEKLDYTIPPITGDYRESIYSHGCCRTYKCVTEQREVPYEGAK